ncbi:hypothetical protein E1A91_D12G168200v1 [Gossypium mustelinum]|uniref:NPH3 domain-containing protein n=1 Tax=Gossypium mustelinum TaxID=34275 RepID=A0A5D2SG89_GOSMU|nr:hypothetical protein E1A91_D12G168200v1 [Gossypium mustelinum]
MKFMKLGSRPDTFYTTEVVRSVSSEVSSDLIIQVKGSRYMLYKFPLLSKCMQLQRICSESPETLQPQIIQLPDFPGKIEAFELCAKFCYGITITLSAYNIMAVRYSIITLQSTKAFSLWSEYIGITSRCIESIASKFLTHPSKVSLSHSHSRRVWDDMSCNGAENQWHQQTIKGIKSGGKIPSNLIGEALQVYASRWLPNISRKVKTNREATTASTSDSDSAGEVTSKHRLVLESLVSLLPSEKGIISCSFLLKLLKEARVSDMLIPCLSHSSDTLYDVDIVLTIFEQFMLQGQSPPTSPPRSKLGIERRRRSRSAENVDLEFQEARRSSASHSSKLKVGRIVDGYLQETSKDVNLPLSKFIAIAETIPNFSRPDHDDLYRAIDIYLKAHPELNKSERKRLCRILDCRKLSVEACMHVAQNEKLPLRVVVQVLFFEQARAAAMGAKVADLPSNIKALLASHNIDPSKPLGPLSTTTSIPVDDEWSNSGIKSPKSRNSRLRTKVAGEDDLDENEMNRDGMGRPSKFKAFCALPRRPKRMFNKLLSINRSGSEKN